LTLRIYDTRAKRKLAFTPLLPGKVGIYVCGITVYDDCHVGHARSMMAFDVIVRHLRKTGLAVTYVRNVTDVDDKIIKRAEEEGRSASEVAETYAANMAADLAALGLDPPDVEPRATQHIADTQAIIGRLIERGLAYAAGGDVYYAVSQFPTYGQLSGQSPDELKAGARIEVGEHKRNPFDFALWKAAKPGEPTWDSPWGPGRPGWHIECSGMAHRYLSETFDLHGGGTDLIFPHHENEIAQSEGAFGVGQFARHWLHSGMVNFGGEKMSKSLGNVVTIRRVAETHDLESLRLLLVSVHYRSPVAFAVARDAEGRPLYPDLDEAEGRLEYFYRTLERIEQFGIRPEDEDEGGGATTVLPQAEGTLAAFSEAMDDDFNTAAALGQLYEAFVLANKLLDDPKAAAKDVRRRTLARLRADMRSCGATLGIFQRPPAEFLLDRRRRLCARRGIDPAAVEGRIAERAAARAAKDFARADQIRKTLSEDGIELMDSAGVTTWRVVS
jgi:cysteinyl-tRNA synthetase